MKLLLRKDSTRGHTRATLFAGEGDGSLANCGQLTMRPEEYDALKAALKMAASQMLFPHDIEIREDNA